MENKHLFNYKKSPFDVVCENGEYKQYQFTVVPAWYEIPKQTTNEELDYMFERANDEMWEIKTAVQDLCRENTWKTRHHILHEIVDTVTALVGVAVMLGADADEVNDVCTEVMLKNKSRRYHDLTWGEDNG